MRVGWVTEHLRQKPRTHPGRPFSPFHVLYLRRSGHAPIHALGSPPILTSLCPSPRTPLLRRFVWNLKEHLPPAVQQDLVLLLTEFLYLPWREARKAAARGAQQRRGGGSSSQVPPEAGASQGGSTQAVAEACAVEEVQGAFLQALVGEVFTERLLARVGSWCRVTAGCSPEWSYPQLAGSYLGQVGGQGNCGRTWWGQRKGHGLLGSSGSRVERSAGNGCVNHECFAARSGNLPIASPCKQAGPIPNGETQMCPPGYTSARMHARCLTNCTPLAPPGGPGPPRAVLRARGVPPAGAGRARGGGGGAAAAAAAAAAARQGVQRRGRVQGAVPALRAAGRHMRVGGLTPASRESRTELPPAAPGLAGPRVDRGHAASLVLAQA